MKPKVVSDYSRSFTPWSMASSQPRKSELAVLVVDADGVTRKFVAATLSRDARKEVTIRVETAQDATSALELLQSSMFDVIVADTELTEMSGVRFLRLLRSEVRYQGIAFLFLTADRRTETKVALLDAGADDVLEKPQDPQVLRAKIRNVAERRLHRAQSAEQALFRGAFSIMALPDVVSLFELARHTGRLMVATRRASGEIQFSEGVLWFARYGNLTGRDAFDAMITETEGDYAFELTPPDQDNRNIFGTAAGLILDAARRLDEGAMKGLAREAPAPVREVPPSADIEPAPAPNQEFARLVETELSNELSLGELLLWTEPELQRWTRGTPEQERMHILLFAPLRVGLASIMAMTAAPSERLMLTALLGGEKVVGASFFLRKGRLLDVIACDINAPDTRLASLKRSPVAAIVYPQDGDFQTVGPRQRDALDNALSTLRPSLIVGAGALELQSKLFDMRAIREHGATVRVLKPGARPTMLDLRFVLRSTATFWGALDR